MQQVALSWLVYRLTRDPFQLGLVGFAGQFPGFLAGLYAGVVVDCTDRRRLVLWTQALALAQALLLAFLTLSGRIEVWHIYSLAALLGIVNAFDIPARQVLIGELVPASDRHNAIALNSTIVNGSRILGPSAAGLIVGLWGEGVCFAINAASFLAVLVGLRMMRGLPGPAAPEAGASALKEIRSGVDYVLREEPIRIILILLGVVSLAGMPFVVLMPVFAEEVLHAGSAGLGLLMGASGVGATLGSLFLARRPGPDGLDRLVLRTTLLFGAALIGFSLSRALWLSALLMAVVGLGVMLQMAGVNTLLQDLSSDRFRGRVMAFYTMMFMGATPIGNFGAGWLATKVGAPWTVSIGACVCVLVALQYVESLPRLLRLKFPGPRTQDSVGPSCLARADGER